MEEAKGSNLSVVRRAKRGVSYRAKVPLLETLTKTNWHLSEPVGW